MTLLNTRTTSVTVYPDRARVTRQGGVELEAGLHILEIDGLPVQVDPDSLRASARGTARARLLGVQAHKSFYAETPAEAVHALEAQVEALQDRLAGLNDQAGRLQNGRANLEALAGKADTYAVALASGEMSLDAQLALYAGVRKQVEEIEAELRATAVEKRETERLLQKAQQELSQQRSSRPRQRYQALVEVEVLQAGELSVELAYVLSGASWKPLYDLRLHEEAAVAGAADGGPVLEMSYLAQVSQATGEAWEAVSLTLSTARPALAGRLPELNPWFLLPYQPPVVPPPAPLPRQAMKASAAMPRGTAPDALTLSVPEAAVEAEAPAASVDASGAAVNYGLSAPASIPSDGEPHKVTIAQLSLPPRLDYVAAPKLVPAAYRRAKVTNDSPYVFLPGAANLFAGDEFIGATRLELTAPQGEIELYLGVDDRVRVERKLKRRDVDKTLIGGKRRIHYSYEITLENLLPHEVRLTLHDQVPVSQHEEIKVRLESVDPRPSEQSQLNLLDWELSLPAGAKRTVRFEFTVEHPPAMQVVGLP